MIASDRSPDRLRVANVRHEERRVEDQKRAQTKLTILMPDALIRLTGRIQAAAVIYGGDGDRLIVIGSNTAVSDRRHGS